ncbi:Uncharacterized membrane protein YebE, DUF533 family [Litoreibacter ascidiaceicola]|uniref:Uncharacterized membrane protein YebE, DUF533 family n=1 Tax=Litoreibacter ascidiaceicola TaxID=1486859 RepID=A0A1M4ZMN5_9RHOB|nr:DUF533 domain-containing protein [Litoreibacter ascidiaceicola]SHF19254.1 Uncharacterized membrane protein YebE, DUF533 family [Litoreibacter ascidiaceicola]
MSLMNMVTKVAIGFAVAKGMQKVQQAGGIGKVMDSLKGGGSSASADGTASTGGLGGMLGGMAGGAGGSGGLGGMLGGLTGGASGGTGGLAGGLGGIGGLLGGLASARGGSGGSLEDLLSQDNPVEEPAEEDTAGLMIRAMVMAARCDGEIDQTERETLMATIGEDATEADMAFVRNAMSEPVDAAAIAKDTPEGLETQVYSMSVMSIEPDNREEAKYLHELATALGIGQATANEIHDSFGVQRLYS